MRVFLHKSVSSAVSVLILLVLLIGCGAACAQPLMEKSSHSCCDPKGGCKSKSSEMKSGACERDAASVPQALDFTIDLVSTPVPHVAVESLATGSDFAIVHSSPPQRLTPLRI